MEEKRIIGKAMSGNSIKNKVIIVTGASGGIGNSIVTKLANYNAIIGAVFNNTFLNDHSDKNVFWINTDITNSEDRDKLVSICLQKFNRIDVLINCAALLEPGEFSSIEEIQLQKMIELNLTSNLILTKKILTIMKSQNFGHIINIGSLGGIVPMPYSAVYSATKFALRGFSFAVAEELKGTGINLSLISPGAVDTKMLDREAQNENTSIAFVSNPVSTEDVAEAVYQTILIPKAEVIIPKGQSVGSRMIAFSPVLFHYIYKILHRVGLSRKRKYLNRYFDITLLKEI